MDTKFAGSAYRYFLIWGICASLAITVCTIVDAILVGNLVGSNGLAVANISTPVFLLYLTVVFFEKAQVAQALFGSSEAFGYRKVYLQRLRYGLGKYIRCGCYACV